MNALGHRPDMACQHTLAARRYMASTGHYLATEAAYEVLAAGGNAVDAGVAANLALGVLQSDQVNVAGVAPMIVYLAAERRVLTISGLGHWPAAASLEHFVDAHGGEIPIGILRTVVPAAPDANLMALERYGTLSLADVAGPEIRHAREGFAMHPLMAWYIEHYADNYRRWSDSARIYLPEGRPPRVGERFVQADLARSLQYMVDEETAAASRGRSAGLAAARDAFYRGDLAQAILRFHREEGGWLREQDLAGFRSGIEPAVRKTIATGRGTVDVYTCGPWCQGPVLLQMLSLLDGVGLREMGHNTTAYVHTVSEAIKLAFADRERYYGDPRFVDVPLERLLSPAYNDERRSLIDPDRAWPELPPPGRLGNDWGPGWQAPAGDGHRAPPGDTSIVSVVDGAGNAFCCNPSDVTWDAPVVPGTGLCPSARGSQSWAVPGHASSVAPGKRPRLTPNPCMVIDEGRLLMPIGTPGGDLQPQAVLQVLLNMLLFDMDTQSAVDAPRFMTHSQPDSFSPHATHPGRLDIEGRIERSVGEDLASRGHRVEWLPDMTWETAGVCLVAKDLETGTLWGGADSRRPSRAMGW